MAVPAVRKYPQDVMDRAVAMVVEVQRQDPGRVGVVGAVGDLMGVHPEVLRHWVKKAESREPQAPAAAPSPQALAAAPSPQAPEWVSSLERENAQLRRANAVLKAAAIMFASELDQGDGL